MTCLVTWIIRLMEILAWVKYVIFHPQYEIWVCQKNKELYAHMYGTVYREHAAELLIGKPILNVPFSNIAGVPKGREILNHTC